MPMILLTPFVRPGIGHFYFLLTLCFQRTDHSHFFITSHKEIIFYPVDLEIILAIDLGDLHLYISIVRTDVVIKTVIIIVAAIIYNNIFAVVIASLIGLLITGIAVITSP